MQSVKEVAKRRLVMGICKRPFRFYDEAGFFPAR